VLERELPPIGAGETSADWSPRDIRAALALDPAFRGRAMAGVLTASRAGARMVDLPPGSDSELRSMIGQHLLETLGPEAADCEFDYWPAGTSNEDDQRTGWGVVYTPRSAALQTARAFSTAGLSCEVLDGLPLALSRAAQMVAPLDEDALVAVDWGYTRVLFVAIRAGRPQFVRLLRDCDFGGLVRSVSRELSLPPHDVERLLALYGVYADDADRDVSELALLLARLAGKELLALEQELLRTLDHLRLHRPGLAPRRIVLSGGGGTIAGIATELANRLDLPVSIWRLDGKVDVEPDGDPQSAVQRQRDCEPLLASAAALSALAWSA
jgi:Tfp pilus assembly PilM family ATPase